MLKLTPFVKHICQICHMYLSKISKIFVWFLKCVMFCTWVSLRGKVKPTTTQQRGHIESLWVLLSTEGSLLSLHCNALLSMLNESSNIFDCFGFRKGMIFINKMQQCNMDNGLWMIIWMMMAEECRHQLCLPLSGGRRRPRQGHLVRPAPRPTHPPRPDQLSVCYEFPSWQTNTRTNFPMNFSYYQVSDQHTPNHPDQLSVCYEFSILSEHVTTTKLIWWSEMSKGQGGSIYGHIVHLFFFF